MKRVLCLSIILFFCILINAQNYRMTEKDGPKSVTIVLKKNGTNVKGIVVHPTLSLFEVEGNWVGGNVSLQGFSDSMIDYDLNISSDMIKGKEVIYAEGDEDTRLFNMTISQFSSPSPNDLISVSDAISIYKKGLVEAATLMMGYGYGFYYSDDLSYHWAKNCEYSNDQMKAIKFGKGTSSVLSIGVNDRSLDVYVFNKGALARLKSQVVALGYKLSDGITARNGNSFDEYSKSGFPQITICDESHDSDMPYRIHISNN